MANTIKVAVKVRPLTKRELKEQIKEEWRVSSNSIVSMNPYCNKTYNFHHVFDKKLKNRTVFSDIVYPIVRQCLQGLNGTIFTYGQTSAGKTFTMIGDNEDSGIIVLAIRQLLDINRTDHKFSICVAFIDVNQEEVYDLLDDHKQLRINQHGQNDVNLSNKEKLISEAESAVNILTQGYRLLKGHAIFRVILRSEDTNGNGPEQVTYLNFVDLAGCNKATNTNNATRVNKVNNLTTLVHLGTCLRRITQGREYAGYRNSNLTRILQASLGGNAHTAVVCNITPGAIEETGSTLRFASDIETIRNRIPGDE